LAEPRSAVVHLAPCLAILAGFALDEMIITRLRQMENVDQSEKVANDTLDTIFTGRAVRILFTYLLIYFIVSAFSISYQETHSLTLSDSSRKAFEWINVNLPPAGRFAVITGDQPLADPVSEWFPAITSQTSVATVQGLEWVPGVDFSNILMRSYRLQQCAVQDSDCVATWQSNSGFDFDYIYLEKLRIRYKQGLSNGPVFLQKSLLDSGRFESIYDTSDVTILKVKNIQ
jgi:hypothetical protein